MPETIYKLTTTEHKTHGYYQWKQGERQSTDNFRRLCADGCLHAYRHPALAVLMDRAHGRYLPDGILWRAETDAIRADDGTKVGTDNMTLIERVPLPSITTEQRVEFAIRVSLLVYRTPGYVEWAERWLDGSDRTRNAAAYAADATYAAYAAADAYAYAYADADADAAADAHAYAYAAAAADAAAAAADAAAAATYAADAAARVKTQGFSTDVLTIVTSMFGEA